MASFIERVNFIALLGRSLQACGAAAHHIERALAKAGNKLGVHTESIAFPTGILTSIEQGEEHRSVVIRSEPGSIDLTKLSLIDETADQALAGQLSLAEAHQRLEILHLCGTKESSLLLILAYMLASVGMITVLQGNLRDALLAGFLGCFAGILHLISRRRPFLNQLSGAFVACFSVCLSTLAAHYWGGIAVDKVILAGIIVLIPGLALVLSFVELSTKNLLSGTARLAGASGELLKIAFTVALSKRILENNGFTALSPPLPGSAHWEYWGVPALALGFLRIFRVPPRYALEALIVSLASYGLTRHGARVLGLELSFFVAGAFVAISSNLLARLRHRPGMITLFPGIILIVPGSIHYRGLVAMFERDLSDSVSASFSVLIIAVSIVAGLFFGNSLLPPRRSL